MALRLYLDDCAFRHSLRQRLVAAGHEVVVPVDVDPDLTGADDDEHLACTASNGLVLLTKNPKDFLALHQRYQTAGRIHAGIFGVYQDNDTGKDMADGDIVNAVANVESTHGEAGIANEFFRLNQYRW